MGNNDNTTTTMFLHRHRSLYFLYLIAAIDLFSVSLFLPLLSKEIQGLGGEPFLVGVIGSVYGAVQLVSSPLMGWLSDKYGSKQVLLFSLLCSAFAYCMQGFASTLAVLFVARVIAGCFKHTQTIGKSIIAELAPHDKSRVLGNINAFGSMGFVVGPAIGAHLVEREGGFTSVCLLAAFGFLVNMFILMTCVSSAGGKQMNPAANPPGSLHHKENGSSNSNSRGLSFLNCFGLSSKPYNDDNLKYSVLGLLFLRFVFSSSTIIPRANLPLTMENKFGTTVVEIGYLNSLQGLTSTLAGFAVGPVAGRFYRNDAESMVKTAGLIKTISIFGMVIAPTFNLVGFSSLIQSAADPFLRVGITSMSLEDHDDPATILGLGQTATSMSRMLGPFFAGTAQTISDDGPQVLGSIAAFAGLVWSYFIGRSKKHHRVISDNDFYTPLISDSKVSNNNHQS